MAKSAQITGMRGVYLVAAELSRLGLIVSPTSRSAVGADLLATDSICSTAYSIQVKTNASTFNFWLVGKKGQEIISSTHLYAFVNIRKRKDGEVIEYFLVPSSVVAKKLRHSTAKSGSEWYSFYREDALPYLSLWNQILPNSAA
jgi:hypothetical protein